MRSREFAAMPESFNPRATRGGGAVRPFCLAAALLRLLFLTEKPLHHDEGVNGLFLVNLFRTGYYHYDPANYHGPSLYYIAVLPTAINNLFHWGHGLSTFAIRFVTAAFGVGTVWLMLCLRRYIGTAGALAAAAFATVSPGFVYFSRYFIHEILFVFFSLGVIVAWLWYRETGKKLLPDAGLGFSGNALYHQGNLDHHDGCLAYCDSLHHDLSAPARTQ